MKNGEQFLYVEKFRPHLIKETILPEELQLTFQLFVDQKNVPNLILAGTPGIGKTTVAMAMFDELDADYLLINGAKDGNIDTLRGKIEHFASTCSLDGNRKYVIMDEADGMTAAAQGGLKAFIEAFSDNCGFVFTCNQKDRIIEPIHSRCAVIDFRILPKERVAISIKQLKRAEAILTSEGVKYDKKVVATLINKHFPDFRRVLGELQRYGVSGTIDNGILAAFSDDSYKTLIGYLKDKDFTNMRKWVGENEPDSTYLFRKLYDTASGCMQTASIPQLVLILGDYQSRVVVDNQINLAACCVEIMSNCAFKE